MDEGAVALTHFDLEKYLPFLIVRAAARLEAASDALFVQKFNINRRAWRVLAALVVEDGQGVTALAQATATEMSTLSRLIDSMELQGLVEKRREKPKMRSVQVHLTTAGSALFEAIEPSSVEMGRILTLGLSERDARTTIKGLRTLYGNIEAAELFISSVIDRDEQASREVEAVEPVALRAAAGAPSASQPLKPSESSSRQAPKRALGRGSA